MQRLIDTINTYLKLDQADLDFAIQFYKKGMLKKGEYLIKAGQPVHHWYFVDTGCVCFYMLKDGKEKVLEFFTAGEFFTDVHAYAKATHSNSYIKAMEDTTYYSISQSNAEKTFDHSHQIERIGRLIMQDTFLKTFRRIAHLNSLSNEERYLRLLKKRPDLIQRVPQYLIASYLGLTPVGLSKIRKRLKQESK